VKAATMLRDTVAACTILAVAILTVAALAGYLSSGLGIALGLLLGSANGYLIAHLFDRDSSFVTTSLMRLALFSALAVGAGMVIGSSVWSVIIGVAAAQLVMVGAGVRHGLRA